MNQSKERAYSGFLLVLALAFTIAGSNKLGLYLTIFAVAWLAINEGWAYFRQNRSNKEEA